MHRLLPLAAVWPLVLAACQTLPPGRPPFELASTEHPGVALGEAERQAAVQRFQDFYAEITPDSVASKTGGLYADNVFFNDTLKTLNGRAAVQAYFLKTTSHTEFVRARVVDVAHSGANTYVRWEMDVKFRGGREPVRTVGMTLLRFDGAGQVVLHQDFWDPAAGFYEHLPVLGGILRWIRSRI